MTAIQPFYSKRLQDWVVDEMCTCGELRSEHGSLVQHVGDTDTLLRLEGEGNMDECPRYTFKGFVTAEKYARAACQEHRLVHLEAVQTLSFCEHSFSTRTRQLHVSRNSVVVYNFFLGWISDSEDFHLFFFVDQDDDAII